LRREVNRTTSKLLEIVLEEKRRELIKEMKGGRKYKGYKEQRNAKLGYRRRYLRAS
jgi:hypothetical protein